MRRVNLRVRNFDKEKFLTFNIDNEASLDEDLLDFIEDEEPEGIVPIIFEEDEEFDTFSYNITDRIRLNELSGQEINAEMVLKVLRGLVLALIDMAEYRIPLSYLVLNRSYIYVDSDYKVDFICIPLEEMQEEVDLNSFLRNFLASLRFDSSENGDYVAKILSYINNSAVFNLRNLVVLIEGFMLDMNIDIPEEDSVEIYAEYQEVEEEPETDIEEEDEESFEEEKDIFDDDVVTVFGGYDKEVEKTEEDGEEIGVEYKEILEESEQELLTEKMEEETEPVTGILEEEEMESVAGTFEEEKTEPVAGTLEEEETEFVTETLEEEEPELVREVVEEQGLEEDKFEEDDFGAGIDVDEEEENFEEQELEDDGFEEESLKDSESEEFEEDIEEKEPEETMVKEPKLKTKNTITGVVIEDDFDDFLAEKEMEERLLHSGETGLKIKKNIKINRVSLMQNAKEEVKEEQTTVLKQQENPEQEEVEVEEKTEQKPKKAKNAKPKAVPKINPYLIRVNTKERIMIVKQNFKIGKSGIGVDYTVQGNGAVSRVHAVIMNKAGEYYIKDNKSTNHTYVNGKIVEDGENELLTHDSIIILGDEEFIFKFR